MDNSMIFLKSIPQLMRLPIKKKENKQYWCNDFSVYQYVHIRSWIETTINTHFIKSETTYSSCPLYGSVQSTLLVVES